jgi:hypothetical protein
MAGDNIYLILLVLVVLITKHLVFDFFLQSLAQIKNKRIYGHPGGLLHAAGHAAGTGLAFFVIAPPLAVGVAIVFAELVIHYHIDWLKEQIGLKMKLQPDQKIFWGAFGIDQWLHHLTYLGIVLVLALTAGGPLLATTANQTPAAVAPVGIMSEPVNWVAR